MRCVFTTLSRLVHCTPPVGVCIVKKNDEPRRRRFYAIEKMRQFDKNTRTSLPKILRLKSSLFYIGYIEHFIIQYILYELFLRLNILIIKLSNIIDFLIIKKN